MSQRLIEEPLSVYFERAENCEAKSTPWRQAPPTWKNSSTKGGRSAKRIKKIRHEPFAPDINVGSKLKTIKKGTL